MPTTSMVRKVLACLDADADSSSSLKRALAICHRRGECQWAIRGGRPRPACQRARAGDSPAPTRPPCARPTPRARCRRRRATTRRVEEPLGERRLAPPDVDRELGHQRRLHLLEQPGRDRSIAARQRRERSMERDRLGQIGASRDRRAQPLVGLDCVPVVGGDQAELDVDFAVGRIVAQRRLEPRPRALPVAEMLGRDRRGQEVVSLARRLASRRLRALRRTDRAPSRARWRRARRRVAPPPGDRRRSPRRSRATTAGCLRSSSSGGRRRGRGASAATEAVARSRPPRAPAARR